MASIPIRDPGTLAMVLRQIAAQRSAAPEIPIGQDAASAGYQYGDSVSQKALDAKKIATTESLGTRRLDLGAAELAEKNRQFDTGAAEKTRQFDTGAAEKNRQFDTGAAEKTRQFDTIMSEKDRQFAAELAQARNYLDTWENQNKWATVIGVGNLAVTGLGALAGNESVKKQQASADKITAGNLELMDIMKKSTAAQTKAFVDSREQMLAADRADILRNIANSKPWVYKSVFDAPSQPFKYINSPE